MPQVETAITRCRRCLTLVYEGAVTCHHCGEDLSRPRRRRIFTRKTWLFIVLVLMGWTGIDAAILFHERKNIYQSGASLIDSFVRDIFRGRENHLHYRWSGREEELEKLKCLPRTLDFREAVRMDVFGVSPIGRCVHVNGYFSHDSRAYAFTAREWGIRRDRPILHGRACVSMDFPDQILCLHLQKEEFEADDQDWCSARSLIPDQK